MSDMSTDHDRLVVELVLSRRKRRGKIRLNVEVNCSPRPADQFVKEISASLPVKAVAALPLGTYRFEIGALAGYKVVEHPDAAPADRLAEVSTALFPVMRRLYVQLAAIHDVMADTDTIQAVVDGMYGTAIQIAAEAREIATLKPGFLTIGIGANPSVFVPFYEKGVDPAGIEFTEPFAYHVIGMQGTQFIGVVSVCQEAHPFAEYVTTRFATLFGAMARARERDGIKSAQRTIEEEIAGLVADRALLAATFGELPPGERVSAASFAAEVQRLSGSAGDA